MEVLMDTTPTLDFKYYNSGQSQLFIGTAKNDTITKYGGEFQPDVLHLDFQTGGLRCNNQQIHCLQLEKNIHKRFADLGEALDNEFYVSNKTHSDMCLNDYVDYDIQLKKYNLSCNTSFRYFEEGFYPFDLDTTVKESYNLTPDLDKLFIKTPTLGRFSFILSRFDYFFFFAGNNSD